MKVCRDGIDQGSPAGSTILVQIPGMLAAQFDFWDAKSTCPSQHMEHRDNPIATEPYFHAELWGNKQWLLLQASEFSEPDYVAIECEGIEPGDKDIHEKTRDIT